LARWHKVTIARLDLKVLAVDPAPSDLRLRLKFVPEVPQRRDLWSR